MIKFDSETGEFSMAGNGMEILVELLGLIHCMYEAYCKDDPNVGKGFKMMFAKHYDKAFYHNDEMVDEMAKSIKEREDAINSAKELISLLEEMVKKKNNDNDTDVRKADFTSDEEFHKWFSGEE